MRERMATAHSFWTVLRGVSIFIVVKALYHLVRDWEWVPNEGGWGTGRIIVLVFWAAVAYGVDLAMRRSIRNWKLLNVLQVGLVTATISIMMWLA